MINTTVTVPNELLARLHTLLATPADCDEELPLRDAVAELLTAVPADRPFEKEYAFEVVLRATARVTASSTREAFEALNEFTDVEANVPYDNVTVTEMSFVPQDVRLIEIDGKELTVQ